MKKIITLMMILLIGTACTVIQPPVYMDVNSPATKLIQVTTEENRLIMHFEENLIPKYETAFNEDSHLLLFFLKNEVDVTDSVLSQRIANEYIKSFSVNDASKTVTLQLQNGVGYEITVAAKQIIFTFSDGNNIVKKTIVLDAGHGGDDSGAVGAGVREKDVNLAVTKLVGEKLQDDFNIVYTRADDTFKTLSERPKIANRINADMFVSIHANAAKSSSGNGFEVFYFSKTSSPYAAKVAAFENQFGQDYGENVSAIAQVKGEIEYRNNKIESDKLATAMVDSYSKALDMRKRGTYGANFAVLRGFHGPVGILIELGFLTNSNDREKLKDPYYQNKMAEEIAKSIREYYN